MKAGTPRRGAVRASVLPFGGDFGCLDCVLGQKKCEQNKVFDNTKLLNNRRLSNTYKHKKRGWIPMVSDLFSV